MPNDRLTADHLATWTVTLLDGDGQPGASHEVEAVYFRADEPSNPGYTIFKNERHKAVQAFRSDRIDSIERTRAPRQETGR